MVIIQYSIMQSDSFKKTIEFIRENFNRVPKSCSCKLMLKHLFVFIKTNRAIRSELPNNLLTILDNYDGENWDEYLDEVCDQDQIEILMSSTVKLSKNSDHFRKIFKLTSGDFEIKRKFIRKLFKFKRP